MLILTRRVGQVIFIGDDITVTVLKSEGQSIKIGIEAPKDIKVHREEVYQKILGLNNERSIYDCPLKKDNEEMASADYCGDETQEIENHEDIRGK